jgi:hypothetical protein
VFADALLMCLLVMSLNLFFRCMLLVSLMVPMYVSYESYAASIW